MVKQVVRAAADLIMIAKKNRSERSESRPKEERFNYRKKGQYTRNCRNSSSNKRKSTEESTEGVKCTQWKKNKVEVAAAKLAPNNNDFNVKPYPAG